MSMATPPADPDRRRRHRRSRAGAGIGATGTQLRRVGAARGLRRRQAPASSSGPTACTCCSASAWRTRCGRWRESPSASACGMDARRAHWLSCRWADGLRRGTAPPTGWRIAATSTAHCSLPRPPSLASHCAPASRSPRWRGQERACRRAWRRGEIVAGCALVGADGLWSSVRQAVCPSTRPQFVGATATRAVIPAADAGRLAAPAVGLWLTPGVHVVHYPVRAGAEIAVVVIAREDWQGRDWEAEADPTLLLGQLRGFHPSLTEVLAGRGAVAQMGALSHATAAQLVGRPRRADGRCRTSHAALPGAGRRAGARGRSRAQPLPGGAGRRRPGRLPGLRGEPPPPRPTRAGHEPAPGPHLPARSAALVGARCGAAPHARALR